MRTNKLLWLGLSVLGCTLACFLCYWVAEITSAPPINVQASDLVGIWRADYSPDEFSYFYHDKCAREKTEGVREILILNEDGTYEQRVERGIAIIHQVEGQRWWIERTNPSSVWLHLKNGIGYPYWVDTFCHCLFSKGNSLVCERIASKRWHISTFNRTMSSIEFDTNEEAVLSIWKPIFGRNITLEYLLGDPDSPIEVQFHRLSNE